MSGPENTFIASVHRHLCPSLYKMKNHNQYNGGIPDVWYSGSKSDLWVEYKFVILPKKDDTLIDLVGGKNPILSELQQHWLKNRHAEGRHVSVIMGSQLGGVWMPGISWEVTLSTHSFRTSILLRNELAKTISNIVS